MNNKQMVFPVNRAILNISEKFDYHIYRKIDKKRFELLVHRDKSFDEKNIASFNKKSNEKVFINIKDKHKYEDDIQKYLSNIIDNRDVSTNIKANLLNELAKNSVFEIFEKELTLKSLENIDKILINSIDLILSDKTAFESMLKITSYDYYTSTHCIDVSTYAIGFGVYLGLKRDELKLLGKGALLHDIGKKNVDKNITCKNGRLTKEEMDIMKNHPIYSADILKQKGEVNKRLINIVEQHHEKCDGSGYPKGLKDKEIDDFAKIVSICDVFNALTTRRSYKDEMSSFEAVKLMYTKMNNELCLVYLEKFVRFLKLS